MNRFIPPIAIAVLSAGLFAPHQASAIEYQSRVQHCLPQELSPVSGAQSCDEMYGVFGLTGPTFAARNDMDVIATGSIKAARDNIHDTVQDDED